jgi:uncharacterized protein YecE (DUF72 family)
MDMRIGCCGFVRGMKNYFKRFDIVEVQQTFYQPPKIETVRRWRKNAPKNFEFCVKAWQLMTHTPKSPTYRRAKITIEKGKEDRYGSFKPTNKVFKAWEKILNICDTLNAKVVIFQCPASFKPTKENIENMKVFFSKIERHGLTMAWEPRGEWPENVIKKLCRDLELIHCVDPFKNKTITKNSAYFRLHGSPPGKMMYNYKYTKKDLNELRKKCSPFKEIYCMFNNLFMWDNSLEFMDMIKSHSL